MPREIHLETRTLTETTNLIKPRVNFWQQLLWPQSTWDPVGTSVIELSFLEGDRESAPFVRRGAAGILMAGDTERFALVEAPNIRIKANLDPRKLADTRFPGQGIFIGSGAEQLSAAERHVAQRMARLRERIDNTMEVMCSQLVQGQISYSVDGQDNFQITLPRDSGHDITLSAGLLWGSGTENIPENFFTVKDLVSDKLGMQVTHCVLGSEAGAEFRLQAADITKLGSLLDNRRLVAMQADLTRQFEQSGAIYLGELSGIQVWQYSRTINVDGVATPMVRPKYAEFISATPAAENVMYFGAIEDLDAMGFGDGGDEGSFQSPFFAKSWNEKDPSARVMLMHSRPLPWTRKANSRVSMKVITG